MGNSGGFVRPQRGLCDLAEPGGCPFIILARSIQGCPAARGPTSRALLQSQERRPRKPPLKTQTRVGRNISLAFIHCQARLPSVDNCGRGGFQRFSSLRRGSLIPGAMLGVSLLAEPPWGGQAQGWGAHPGVCMLWARCTWDIPARNSLSRLSVCTCHLTALAGQWFGMEGPWLLDFAWLCLPASCGARDGNPSSVSGALPSNPSLEGSHHSRQPLSFSSGTAELPAPWEGRKCHLKMGWRHKGGNIDQE